MLPVSLYVRSSLTVKDNEQIIIPDTYLVFICVHAKHSLRHICVSAYVS